MQLNSVETLLLRSSSQIEQADKFLTYLTTFLPGQSPSMELVSEALVSASAILQTYKNQVLNKIVDDQARSLESRYLDAEYRTHQSYCVLAYSLSALKSTELFIEMTASHLKGERGRWGAVLGLESLKAAVRLGMLGLSRRILPSTTPVHEVEADQTTINKLLDDLNRGDANTSKFDEKMALEAGAMQQRRALIQPPDMDRLRPAGQLIRKLNPQLAVSEVIMILRPVIYSVLLYRYRGKKRSWAPWLLGVALELAARELAKATLRKGPRRLGTKLEKEIYGNRDKDLLWWLMRSRMYEDYTRKFIMGFADKLMKWPILNMGGLLMQDVAYLFDEYYFASATL